ncbi:MAG: response regulator transcription factor [Nitrospirae bacterium]|nr:response regulator transcription factor [Nitrospirota bacterium]
MERRCVKKITVLLIDDHALFREGLRALLSRQDDIEIVGEAGGGKEGIQKAIELMPDVALMDLKMPDMTGLEALCRIIEKRPQTKVIILTVSEDDEDLFTALRHGACGYLLKTVEVEKLLNSIYEVARGGACLSERLAGKIMKEFREMSSKSAIPVSKKESLTSREMEILSCITRGKSNKEIATILNIAESTVKIHVQNMLKKLNLASRVEAAVYAMKHKLFTDMPPRDS